MKMEEAMIVPKKEPRCGLPGCKRFQLEGISWCKECLVWPEERQPDEFPGYEVWPWSRMGYPQPEPSYHRGYEVLGILVKKTSS